MRRHYLHLSACSCDNCKGPVVSGWLALREIKITKETFGKLERFASHVVTVKAK